MKHIIIAAGLTLAVATGQANADVIAFESTNLNNYQPISANFGSIAGVLDVSYSNPTDGSLGTQFRMWESEQYSGKPAAYAGLNDFTGTGFITLKPLNGYQITLNGFFLGSYLNAIRNTSFTIDNLSTAGVDFSSGPITVGSAGREVSSGISSTSGITIGFGPNAFNVGINYIDFTVSAVTVVPEPESYALLLAGLGLMGFAARRSTKAV